MNDDIPIQLIASALLGGTVGLDHYIEGRKSAVLVHMAASVLGGPCS